MTTPWRGEGVGRKGGTKREGREEGSGGKGWRKGETYGGEGKGVNYRGGKKGGRKGMKGIDGDGERREEEEGRERGVSENATYTHQRHHTHT